MLQNEPDAEAWLARISALPGFYRTETANMARGIGTGFTQPRRTVERAIADVRAQGSAAMLKFNAPVVDLLAYYDGCLAAVRDGVPAGLATELDWALAELRALLALPGRPGFAAARP